MMSLLLLSAVLMFGGGISSPEVSRAAEQFFATKQGVVDARIEEREMIRRSAHGIHVSYRRSHDHIPIVEHLPKTLHFTPDLKRVTAFHLPAVPRDFPLFRDVTLQQRGAILEKLNEKHGTSYRITGEARCYWDTGDHMLAAYQFILQGESELERLVVEVDSISHTLLSEYSPIFEADSGTGLILRHNPIAASRQAGDENLYTVVALLGLDGSGYLRGSYVDVTNPEYYEGLTPSRLAGNYAPGAAFEPSLNYSYLRDDLRYEEVAAYYWIDKAQRYLLSKGQNIANYVTKVHVHAFEGTNAFFTVTNQGIYLGDGFVDTGEDGSIILHEYGHAVLHDIVRELPPHLNRGMLHEGFADFFSYLIASESTAAVGPDRYPHLVGEWFASNERAAPTYLRSLLAPDFSYPFIGEESHYDGQLWASSFYELAQELGNDTALTIIVEAMYLTDSFSARSVGTALIAAEQQVYGGAHHQVLARILRARGLYETEQRLPILEIVPGQSMSFQADAQWLRFTAPDSGQLELRFSSDQFGYADLALFKDRVESRNLAQRSEFIQENATWKLNPKSRPALVAGATYYLSFNASKSITVQLKQTQPDEAIPAEPHTAYTYQMGARQVKYYHLTQLGEAKRILIQYTSPPNSNTLLKVYDHDFDPYLDQNPDIHTYALNQNGNLVLNLEDLFPNPEQLYLSISNPYSAIAGFFTWQALGRIETQTLVRDETLELPLREPWNNTWSFSFKEEVPNLVLETDQAHAFRITRPDSDYELRSSWSGSKQQIVLAPSGQRIFFPPTGPAPSDYETTIGTYRITFEGEPGQTVSFRAHGPSEPVQELSLGAVIQAVMGPQELIHYRFNLPENAADFRLNLIEGALGVKAFIYRNGEPEKTWGPSLSPNQPLYRMNATSQSISYDAFGMPIEPGYAYELLVYNPYQEQRVRLGISYAPIQPLLELHSGMQVTLPFAGLDYLLGNAAYLVPMQVNPPPGTQRILVHFDQQTGPTRVRMAHSDANSATTFYLADTQLSRYNLGFVPDHPFTILFLHDLQSFTSGNPSFQVTLEYLGDTEFHGVLSPETPSLSGTRASSSYWYTQLEIPAGTRQFDFAFTAESDNILGSVRATRGLEKPIDGSEIREPLSTKLGLSWHESSDYAALSDTPWFIQTYISNQAKHNVGYNAGATPLSVNLSVRYRNQEAQTVRHIPHAVGKAQVVRARQRYHNPSDQERFLSLSEGGQVVSHEVAAHGFLAQTIVPGATVTLSADGPLILSEGLEGANFLTSASGPAYLEDRYKLPHVSPDASDWTAYCQGVVTSDRTSAFLYSPGFSGSLPLGDPVAMENSGPLATWRTLETGMGEGERFRETTMATTLYWQNQNQLVEELAPSEGARTFFVPHLPDNPAWWSGLTLSNPNETGVVVRILAYGPDGAMARSVAISLEANASKAGLMSDYIDGDYRTGQLSWLRIESDLPILAMEFMGGLHTGDTAGFVLPHQDGSALVLPGNLNETPFGVALVNTINQAGSCTLMARAPNGSIFGQQTYEMNAFERVLITDNNLNIPAGQPYSLEVVTEDLRLVGMQLDNDAAGRLAATAAQVWR